MNVEEALRDAMAAQVAGVQAPPSLGQAIRRRNRRHVLRFRTAGAAVLTAAVAVGVPVALTAGPDTVPAGGVSAGRGAGTPGVSPIGSADAVAVPGNVVPDLIGKTAAEAGPILKEAGYTMRVTEITTGNAPAGKVIGQMPQSGMTAPAGAAVTIVVAVAPVPTPGVTAVVPTPWALRDLGDGRTLGGVRVGYMPKGL
ncbi:MAG: PASTA domain-containing protein, partial [Microbispora sp.]|nr:PASTA domain-containing protein [Microbispora sp.]